MPFRLLKSYVRLLTAHHHLILYLKLIFNNIQARWFNRNSYNIIIIIWLIFFSSFLSSFHRHHHFNFNIQFQHKFNNIRRYPKMQKLLTTFVKKFFVAITERMFNLKVSLFIESFFLQHFIWWFLLIREKKC